MLVTVSGIVSSLIPHDLKADESIVCRFCESFSSVKLLHPSKALYPMLVTVSDISSFVREEQSLNALPKMFLRADESFTEHRFLHEEKVQYSIEVIVSGISTDSIALLLKA